MKTFAEDDDNVIINGKQYSDLPRYELNQLRNMLRLAQHEIDNYKRHHRRLVEYLQVLELRKTRIQAHIDKKDIKAAA